MQALRSSPTFLLAGTLTIGAIDALYAVVFWVPRGGTPTRIFQSIASGLLGRSAFEGGEKTALLGLALHFLIAFGIVLVYWLASARLPLLIERPLWCGGAYGLLVYGVMNYVVIPLSAMRPARFLLPWIVWSIVVHIVMIGIPAAFFAKLAHRPTARSRRSS